MQSVILAFHNFPRVTSKNGLREAVYPQTFFLMYCEYIYDTSTVCFGMFIAVPVTLTVFSQFYRFFGGHFENAPG